MEHLFIWLPSIFFVKVSVTVFGLFFFFFNGIVFLLLKFLRVLYIFRLTLLSYMFFANVFLPVYGLSFHSLDVIFCRAQVSHFSQSNIIISFMDGTFSAVSKVIAVLKVIYSFFYVILWEFYSFLNFTLRSVICIELIF